MKVFLRRCESRQMLLAGTFEVRDIMILMRHAKTCTIAWKKEVPCLSCKQCPIHGRRDQVTRANK